MGARCEISCSCSCSGGWIRRSKGRFCERVADHDVHCFRRPVASSSVAENRGSVESAAWKGVLLFFGGYRETAPQSILGSHGDDLAENERFRLLTEFGPPRDRTCGFPRLWIS